MEKKCAFCNKLFGDGYPTSRVLKQKYCSYSCRDNAHKKQVTKICQYCNTEFSINICWLKRGRRDGKYCSKECYDKAQTVYPIRYCQKCHKPFRTCGKLRKFCSLKCAYGNRNRDINKTGKWYICKCCQKKFYVELRHIKEGRGDYCSRLCRKKHLWGPKGIIKNCLHCQKSFRVLKIIQDIKHFCSFSCYRKYRGESNPERLFREALEKESILFKQEVQFGKFSVDFIIDNIAVEIDGNYWHNSAAVKARDKRKDELLRSKGYQIIRFTETEITKNIKTCINKLVHGQQCNDRLAL